MVRLGRVADFGRVQAVAVAAGEMFREVGLGFIADMPPPPDAALARYADDGRMWVVDDDGPIAYQLVDVVGGCAHIAEVSADPAHRGRRLGSLLIDQVDGWAKEQGFDALTLTTYRDVPWNRPYYARLGFRVIKPTPELADVVAHEARLGLDPDIRVCMRRELTR